MKTGLVGLVCVLTGLSSLSCNQYQLRDATPVITKMQESPQVISKAMAIELAKREYVKQGGRIEDCTVSGVTGNDKEWFVYFDRIKRGKYYLPAGHAMAVITKKGDKVIFVPGY